MVPGKLLNDNTLERSAVVANCRMNRERDLTGSNGYARELGRNPLDYLKECLALQDGAAWLDLCCGTGRALIRAAEQVHAAGLASRVEILGIDLAGLFDHAPAGLSCVRLVEASLSRWQAERAYDLVTCVHGLHYVGDKLGLIARAATWLTAAGLFVANLDLANLKFGGERAAARWAAAELRRSGLEYDRRRRRVVCWGRREVSLSVRYLGADDMAGPNYTGQPAVDSYYEPQPDGQSGRA
jgi:SAM-dependent methyltransferase